MSKSHNSSPHIDEAHRPSIANVFFPYWLSNEKWLALAIFALILAISFASTYGYVKLNSLHGELADALIALNWETLKPLFVLTLFVGLGTVLLPIGSTFLSGFLELKWRTWITETYLAKWTQNNTFYKLERDNLISNADQRIAEDIRLFTHQSLTMVTSLISAVIQIVSYTLVLWHLSGALEIPLLGHRFEFDGYMVFAAYLYCIVQLLLSHWLGKHLIGLNMHKQTVEADFRHHGMQLREYAEPIAFYHGGAVAQHELAKRYGKIYHNTIDILGRTFKLTFGQHLYTQVFALLPTLLALPLLLAGKISYGELVKITGAYTLLVSSLSFFQQAYQGFTNWLALTNRLRDFITAVNRAENQHYDIALSTSSETDLICKQLCIISPAEKKLITQLNWHVHAGERWLIKGHSGCGKSTLLRACAGLWPFGSGEIIRPRQSTLFIPQRSYIPSGSLKAALCYPQSDHEYTDDACKNALIACQLSAFADLLSCHAQWQQQLSGGEQQRLAIARALLQQPHILFLDEATSALDAVTESNLYATLTAELLHSTIVSVAHRTSLDHFHTHVLDVDEFVSVS